MNERLREALEAMEADAETSRAAPMAWERLIPAARRRGLAARTLRTGRPSAPASRLRWTLAAAALAAAAGVLLRPPRRPPEPPPAEAVADAEFYEALPMLEVWDLASAKELDREAPR